MGKGVRDDPGTRALWKKSGIDPGGTRHVSPLGTGRARAGEAEKRSLVERLAQRWALRNHTIPEQIRFDEKVLRQTVNATWPEIAASEPRNAERIITPDDRVEYRNEVPAHRVDFLNASTNAVRKRRSSASFRTAEPSADHTHARDHGGTAQKIERKLVEFTTYFRSSQQDVYITSALQPRLCTIDF